MLATIIFTVYNNIGGYEVTLNSLLEQDFTDAEIIISDDGSKKYDLGFLDEIGAKLERHYPQVRINRNPMNMGTVAHVNKLYAMAEGKYILGCSPGDAFHSSHTVGRIVREMERRNSLILTGRRVDVYKDRKKVRPGIRTGIWLRFFPKAFMNFMITKRSPISSCSTAYAKELFMRYGYQDEDIRLLDDIPYYVSLLQKGARIDFTREIFIDHEMTGGVSTGKVHPQIYEDIHTMRKKLLENPIGLTKKTVEFLKNNP